MDWNHQSALRNWPNNWLCWRCIRMVWNIGEVCVCVWCYLLANLEDVPWYLAATLFVYATGQHSCLGMQHSEQMLRTTQEALCAHMLLAFRPLLKKDSKGDVQMMFLLDARKALGLILELNMFLFCLSLSDPKAFKNGKTSTNKSFWPAKPASFGSCLVMDRCHVTVGSQGSEGSSSHYKGILLVGPVLQGGDTHIPPCSGHPLFFQSMFGL